MSLRRTAFLWFAAVMAAVGLIAALASWWLMRGEAAEFLDSQLRQVAIYVGDAAPGPAPPAVPEHDPEDDFLIQVWDETGHPLRISDGTIPLARNEQTGFATSTAAGEDWRVFTLVRPASTVQVSQRISVRQELATEAAWRAALPILLLIPLAWLMLNAVVDRVMARLNRLAVTVAGRDPKDIRPIPLDDVPAEVLPFVRSINQLLARLFGLMERQRQFLSDAAHELRTPLAALQLQIGNLRNANIDARLDGRLTDMEAGVRRASILVGQLLRLARYDADTPDPARRTDVDLTAVTLAVVAQLAPLAEQKGVDLGVVRQDAASSVGDAEDFAIIIGNLIDNAIRYTPAGGTADVAIRAEPGRISLEVADTGPGIEPALLPRIFERFFRAAPADVEGNGLGLAIAAAAASRNTAALTIENRHDRNGLVARLTVPTPT